jgi:methylamine dehydrogenase accessory protein MauD
VESVGNWESGKGALNILLASDGDPSGHRSLVDEYGIDPDSYVLSSDLGLQFMVDKLPFAVLIDEGGILRAKGLVNSREHLESLFEARRQGVATLQEHFLREGLLHEVA